MRSIVFSRVGVQNNGNSLAHSVISSRNVVAVSSLAYRIFELVRRRLTLRLENYRCDSGHCIKKRRSVLKQTLTLHVCLTQMCIVRFVHLPYRINLYTKIIVQIKRFQ